MKKKVKIISVALCILIAIIVGIGVKRVKQSKSDKMESLVSISYEENIEESEEITEQISEITQNQGLQADTSIYQLATEYDGREVVIVNPKIQYKVVMAGVIKKDKPEFDEIDEILKKAPLHTGIWIEEEDREKFLQIIQSITQANYSIDEEGFLLQEEKLVMNQYDKKIKEMLNANILYAFDINSICYTIDEVTGEILEYPFEEMDPYTSFEYFEDENKSLFIVTQNSLEKLNYEDIFKEIFENITA